MYEIDKSGHNTEPPQFNPEVQNKLSKVLQEIDAKDGRLSYLRLDNEGIIDLFGPFAVSKLAKKKVLLKEIGISETDWQRAIDQHEKELQEMAELWDSNPTHPYTNFEIIKETISDVSHGVAHKAKEVVASAAQVANAAAAEFKALGTITFPNRSENSATPVPVRYDSVNRSQHE